MKNVSISDMKKRTDLQNAHVKNDYKKVGRVKFTERDKCDKLNCFLFFLFHLSFSLRLLVTRKDLCEYSF